MIDMLPNSMPHNSELIRRGTRWKHNESDKEVLISDTVKVGTIKGVVHVIMWYKGETTSMVATEFIKQYTRIKSEWETW